MKSILLIGMFLSLKTLMAEGAPAYDAELTNFSYPRAVQFFKLHSQKQDLQMAYELAEPEHANGKTVLLLHGKNFSAAYWETTIQVLLEKGYRVLAPDQIGFGKSSKPENYQFTFQQLAQNTKALLDSLQIQKINVVGHSMGGMLAARFALMFPTVTEKLILVNPIGLEDWKLVVPYLPIDQLYAAELKQTPDSLRDYQKQVYFHGEWKPEYESLVDILAGWTRHLDYPRVAWNNALTTDMIFTQPVVNELSRIKNKTLLIIGQLDHTAIGKQWASPEVAKTLGNYVVLGKKAAKAIKGSKLVEIKEAGHVPQIEKFDEYIEALQDFLAK
jgi:pimeloyl-ACP methyl ester carboxylesterase